MEWSKWPCWRHCNNLEKDALDALQLGSYIMQHSPLYDAFSCLCASVCIKHKQTMEPLTQMSYFRVLWHPPGQKPSTAWSTPTIKMPGWNTDRATVDTEGPFECISWKQYNICHNHAVCKFCPCLMTARCYHFAKLALPRSGLLRHHHVFLSVPWLLLWDWLLFCANPNGELHACCVV